MPCGIVLARRRNVERISRAVAYIGTVDTTVTGSRNAFTPLVLWYAIRCLGEAGMRARIRHSLDTAEYAQTRFRRAGIDAWRNPQALTVVFPAPPRAVRDKWQLASSDGISHVICMPHVTREQIDGLLRDIIRTRGETQ